jgi:hypothetical protein
MQVTAAGYVHPNSIPLQIKGGGDTEDKEALGDASQYVLNCA